MAPSSWSNIGMQSMQFESVVHNNDGALNGFCAGLAFSAFTIAVSEPFLLPTAEKRRPIRRHVLAPGS